MARTVGLLLTEEKTEERQEAYVCPHCGKEYKSASALKAHVTKNHPQTFDDAE